jgi:hypothetical protein
MRPAGAIIGLAFPKRQGHPYPFQIPLYPSHRRALSFEPAALELPRRWNDSDAGSFNAMLPVVRYQ